MQNRNQAPKKKSKISSDRRQGRRARPKSTVGRNILRNAKYIIAHGSTEEKAAALVAIDECFLLAVERSQEKAA